MVGPTAKLRGHGKALRLIGSAVLPPLPQAGARAPRPTAPWPLAVRMYGGLIGWALPGAPVCGIAGKSGGERRGRGHSGQASASVSLVGPLLTSCLPIRMGPKAAAARAACASRLAGRSCQVGCKHGCFCGQPPACRHSDQRLSFAAACQGPCRSRGVRSAPPFPDSPGAAVRLFVGAGVAGLAALPRFPARPCNLGRAQARFRRLRGCEPPALAKTRMRCDAHAGALAKSTTQSGP